jgi:hypothetical protein
MNKYSISFEYYDEVEAESELDALLISTENICEWVGSEAHVEKIEDN